MPTFRIVYIDDDTFRPRTLTASFADRAAAEIAMAKHGHRVVHVVELRADESPDDPVAVPIVPGSNAGGATAPRAASERARAPRPLLGLPRYDLAGVTVFAAGIAVAISAILLF
jgi:hypothetical protein